MEMKNKHIIDLMILPWMIPKQKELQYVKAWFYLFFKKYLFISSNCCKILIWMKIGI